MKASPPPRLVLPVWPGVLLKSPPPHWWGLGHGVAECKAGTINKDQIQVGKCLLEDTVCSVEQGLTSPLELTGVSVTHSSFKPVGGGKTC